MKLICTLPFVILTCFGYAQPGATGQLIKYTTVNYTVQYPTSWKIDTSKKMGTDFIIFSSKENDSDKFSENINLIVQDLTGQNMDLDKYAQASEAQINKLATDGEIYESVKIKTGKTGYYKVIFGMRQGIFKLKIEQYCFIRNDRAFVVTFSSELHKFDIFKIAGEEILNSFTLTN